MEEQLLLSLTYIVTLGILAQVLAWRFRLPAILLLLVFGILAGPATGLIKPDEIFGDLLFPFVSLSVAVILFEGGLTLRFEEIRTTGRTMMMLVTVGALITWAIGAAAAYWLLKLPLELAILQGAILIVTGPTVIIPLLRHVRPARKIGSLIKWEGIIIDPIGAVLAVLVFEVLTAGTGEHSFNHALIGLLKASLTGAFFGSLGAWLTQEILKRHLVPDLLHNSAVLVILLASYAGSNTIMHEAGLISVTVMGIILANQKQVSIERIAYFKEDLRVLLLSMLFIILSARLDLDTIRQIGLPGLAFLAVLILVARPVTVFLSTAGSKLNTREKVFMSLMAPRGIVAASVSSIFALKLAEKYPEALRLMPITFLVIIGTVVFYGFASALAGKWLGVSQPHPNGFLFFGAHDWACKIALALKEENVPIVMVDSNWNAVQKARMAGLNGIYGNFFSQNVLEYVETSAIGRLIAMTSNFEVNSLAADRYRHLFGSKEVYQLVSDKKQNKEETLSQHHGRFLFSEKASYGYLYQRFLQNAEVKRSKITKEYTYDHFRQQYPEHTPLFLIDEDRKIIPVTIDAKINPQPGTTLIALIQT